MDESKVFAERLKQKRTEKQISLRELALKTGLSPTTVSSYERGDKSPSLNNVALIAKYLDVSIDWLCGIEEEKPKNLKDIVKTLLKLIEYFVIQDSDNHRDFLLYFETQFLPDNCRDTFIKFFSGWKQIQQLTIVEEPLYKQMTELWLNEEFKKLEKLSLKNEYDELF